MMEAATNSKAKGHCMCGASQGNRLWIQGLMEKITVLYIIPKINVWRTDATQLLNLEAAVNEC